VFFSLVYKIWSLRNSYIKCDLLVGFYACDRIIF
jgi:hypothetical protein